MKKAVSMVIAAALAGGVVLVATPAQAAPRRTVVTPQASMPAGATMVSGTVTVKKGKKTVAKNKAKVTLSKKGTYTVKSVVKWEIPARTIPGATVTRQKPSSQKWVSGTTTKQPDTQLPPTTRTEAVREIDLVNPVCVITYEKVTWSSGAVQYRQSPVKYKIDERLYRQGDCTAGFVDPETGVEQTLTWRDDWDDSRTCYPDNAYTNTCVLVDPVVEHPGRGWELDKAVREITVPGAIIPGAVSTTPGHWETIPGETYTETAPSTIIPASTGTSTDYRKVRVR